MDNSFLYSLIDTTGNHFVFGKSENPQQDFFLKQAIALNKKDTTNFIQLYKGNELKAISSSPIYRNNFPPDWIFPILMLLLAFFAWMRFYYNRYFSQLTKAFLNFNLSNQIVRDENIFFQRISIYLNIVFNLSAALFIYLLSVQYHWKLEGMDSSFVRFIFFIILVGVTYSLKFLVLKICGWLFEQEKEMSAYIFNIFLINNILGIALLPFICIFAFIGLQYFSSLYLIPFLLIGLGFGLRIFRGIQIGFGASSFSPLYLFLYLCTLEIAPLIVLIRIIVQ